MANFFTLTSQQTEDKVVGRLDRIYADALTFIGTGNFSVQTKSKANRLRIKFFLGAMRVRTFGDDYGTDPTDFEDKFYKIGKWYELEHTDSVQFSNSVGFFSFRYLCGVNNGSGGFSTSIIIDDIPQKEIQFYISSVTFQDSFYNADYGWLNPDNPAHIDDIETEISQTLPGDAEPDDFLVYDSVDGPKWKSGPEIAETLPVPIVADPTATPPVIQKRGAVYVDNKTINVTTGGVISVPIDNETLIVDDDDTSPTYQKLKVVGGGGGGVPYSTTEQDTGTVWVDGKPIYQRTFIDPPIGLLVPGVETLVNTAGMSYHSTSTQHRRGFPQYYADSNYIMVSIDTSNNLNLLRSGTFLTCRNVTVWYTKV